MARIDPLLDAALTRKASALHVSPGRPPLYRIRGELVTARATACSAAEVEGWLGELLDEGAKARLARDFEVEFSFSHGDKARFCASYFQKSAGLGAVFKIVPADPPTLEDLGAPAALKTIAEMRSGLVLVAGAVGSGKSSTIAAMVRHVCQTRACHVVTLERPVEFVHAGGRATVTHREIGRNALDFATALANVARDDADVVVIGDLATAEVMGLALELARGSLVLAPIHASGAQSAIERFIGGFEEREQRRIRLALADTLGAVVAQELVPMAAGRDRVAAFEVMLGSGAGAQMIRDARIHQLHGLMLGGRSAGMQTMDGALAQLVVAGTVTAEAALARARDREAVTRAVRAGKQG